METINLILKHWETMLRVFLIVWFFNSIIKNFDQSAEEVLDESVEALKEAKGGKVIAFMLSALYDVIFCLKCLTFWMTSFVLLIKGCAISEAFFLALLISFAIFTFSKSLK